MEQSTPWAELTKYFAGELTEAENRKMKMWIKADPVREEQVHKLYEIWTESGTLPYELNVDESWNRLAVNIGKLKKEWESESFDQPIHDRQSLSIVNPAVLHGRPGRKTGRVIRRVALAAAMIVIIVTAILFSYRYQLESTETLATEDVGSQVFETQDGERVTYVLSDGSRIILHAGSRLEIPIGFNVHNREVVLEGEAFFDVEHDPQNPFIVHSEHAYTRVIGTSFLVQAWAGPEKEVDVIVVEGRVALGDSRTRHTGDNETVISKNQRASMTANEGTVVSDIDDMDWYLGWTTGRLVFDDRPLSEIISRLERWYAVEIQTEEESIDMKNMTAEIDFSQPMDEVLNGIALSLGLDLEKNHRNYTFRLKKE